MTVTTDTSIEASALTSGLRLAADLLEQHPDLPTPYVTSVLDDGVELNWYLRNDTDDLTEQRDTAQRIIRTLGGHWNKKAHAEAGMEFTRGVRYSDPVVLTILVAREAVCRRVVTGTEQVTIPAIEAQPARVETREVVTWECEPVLAAAAAGAE